MAKCGERHHSDPEIDLEHARAPIEEQQAEFAEERTHIEATIQGQLNSSTVQVSPHLVSKNCDKMTLLSGRS